MPRLEDTHHKVVADNPDDFSAEWWSVGEDGTVTIMGSTCGGDEANPYEMVTMSADQFRVIAAGALAILHRLDARQARLSSAEPSAKTVEFVDKVLRP